MDFPFFVAKTLWQGGSIVTCLLETETKARSGKATYSNAGIYQIAVGGFKDRQKAIAHWALVLPGRNGQSRGRSRRKVLLLQDALERPVVETSPGGSGSPV